MTAAVVGDRARVRDLFRDGLGVLTVGSLLLLACNAFEIIGSAAVMPAVLTDLGGLSRYGAALAAPLIASVLGLPLAGRLADRYGIVRPLIGALAVFAGGLILTSLAPDMTWVAVGRFVQGLGAGACSALELVIVARYVPMRVRPLLLAMFSAVFLVPGLVGPSLTALVVRVAGWRWVFAGIIPVLVVCAALLLPVLVGRPPVEESGDGEVDHGPLWGPFALAGGLAVTVIAADLAGWVWVPLVAAGLVVAAVGARAVLPRGTFSARPGFPATVACALYVSVAYLTMETFIPLLLNRWRGVSLLEAALPLTFASIFWTSGSWVQTKLAPRRRGAAVAWGGVLAAVGVATTAALVSTAVPFWLAYPATAVGSFGCGMAFTIAQVIAVELAPAGREGAFTSSVQLANLLGAAAGTAASAVVLARLSDQLGLSIALTMGAAAVFGVVTALTGPRLP